jgi:hypothetical protein
MGKNTGGLGSFDLSVPKDQMINTAGLPEEEQQDIMDAREKSLDALEQRYAQPNWFKVSAGFLKPQLGGFGASLGSAFDAMGENVEQQRALAPTIAVERAKLEQMRSLMGKSERAANMVAKLVGLGPNAGRKLGAGFENLSQFITPENQKKVAGAIVELKMIGENDKADALKAALDAQQTKTVTQGQEVNTAALINKEEREDPALNLQKLLSSSAGKSPEEINKILKGIDAERPPQTDANLWATMSRGARMQAQVDYQKKQQEIGLSEEQIANKQAASADVRLPLLSGIRSLALGIGIPEITNSKGIKITGQQQMAGLLNYFGGNNPAEVVARAAADGKFGAILAGIDDYARQNQMSEQAKIKFQELVKLLNENQVSLRSSSLSTTDAAAAMQLAASPNIGNSQKALVTLVDLIAHSEKHAQNRAYYISTAGVPARMLRFDPKYKDLQKKYDEEHEKILASDPTQNTPSWFGPPPSAPAKSSQTSQSKPSSKERSNERQIGGQTWVRQPNGTYEVKAR